MRDEPKSVAALMLLSLFAVTSLLAYSGLNHYREARVTAVRSYIESVCSAVEEYKVRKAEYPSGLEQIDSSTLDNDLGIPLASLDYDVGESGIRVSYTQESGEEISCKR